jgi:hypothetical protein
MTKKSKIIEVKKLIDAQKNSPLAKLTETELAILKKHGVSTGKIAAGEGFIESVPVTDEQEANQLDKVLRKFVGLSGWHNGILFYWVKGTKPRKKMPWGALSAIQLTETS